MIVFIRILDFIKAAEKKFGNLKENEPVIIVSNDIYEKILVTTEAAEKLGAEKNKRFASLENKEKFIKKKFDIKNIRILSRLIFNKLQGFTPFLEKILWDEFILEIEKTQLDRLLIIKKQIEKTYDCRVKIGLSEDKFLARVASFYNDEEVNELNKNNIENLTNIKIERGLWGIGKKIPILLKQAGIDNLGTLRQVKKEFLSKILDAKQLELLNKILDFNNTELNPFRFPVSLSREIFIPSYKAQDREFIRTQIRKLSKELCAQLIACSSLVHTLTLRINFFGLNPAEKTQYFSYPTSSENIITLILLKNFQDIALTAAVKSLYISYTDIISDINNYFCI